MDKIVWDFLIVTMVDVQAQLKTQDFEYWFSRQAGTSQKEAGYKIMSLFLYVVALVLSFVNVQNKREKNVPQYAKIQILTNLTILLFDVCNKHLWKIFQENF